MINFLLVRKWGRWVLKQVAKHPVIWRAPFLAFAIVFSVYLWLRWRIWRLTR